MKADFDITPDTGLLPVHAGLEVAMATQIRRVLDEQCDTYLSPEDAQTLAHEVLRSDEVRYIASTALTRAANRLDEPASHVERLTRSGQPWVRHQYARRLRAWAAEILEGRG